ncbi:CPBP family intramembrane metalloprotease [Candidatus Gracilibacteria bacterium]|nr:CPBP family intramembrane metalloprotease [Candidatus Gracilibacteria bacterium]
MQTNDTLGSLYTEPADPAWGWRDVAAALLFALFGGIVLLMLSAFAVASLGLPEGEGLTSPIAFVFGAGIYMLLIVGVYLFAARRAGWQALGLGGTAAINYWLVPPLFLLGMGGLLLANGAIAFFTGSFENPQVEAITGGGALSTRDFVLLFVLIAVLAPFAEELFFRGMLYPLLRRGRAAWLAITINALLFALVHFIPLLIPGLFIVGLLLAYLRERSASIWPSICFHMLQNSLALIAIYAAFQMEV